MFVLFSNADIEFSNEMAYVSTKVTKEMIGW